MQRLTIEQRVKVVEAYYVQTKMHFAHFVSFLVNIIDQPRAQ